MWGKENLYTGSRNVKWFIQYGKQYGVSSKKNLELPCDIAIPLLGMYLEKQKQKLKQKQNKTAQ